MQITWNRKETDFSWPVSFEEKVEIFYQRALGWQLHIADLIANGGQPLGEFNLSNRCAIQASLYCMSA
jgi:hypothetical protein